MYPTTLESETESHANEAEAVPATAVCEPPPPPLPLPFEPLEPPLEPPPSELGAIETFARSPLELQPVNIENVRIARPKINVSSALDRRAFRVFVWKRRSCSVSPILLIPPTSVASN
jgi:hypothetical protein